MLDITIMSNVIDIKDFVVPWEIKKTLNKSRVPYLWRSWKLLLVRYKARETWAKLQNTPLRICVSLNRNSIYCYTRIPRSSKHTDTCNGWAGVFCNRSDFCACSRADYKIVQLLQDFNRDFYPAIPTLYLKYLWQAKTPCVISNSLYAFGKKKIWEPPNELLH